MSDEIIEPKPNKDNTSLDPKVIATLAYFLFIVSGIILFSTSKDRFVRFHAMQSILFTGLIAILYVFFTIFGMLFWILLAPISLLTWAVIFATWIVLMIKAYQNEYFKLPFIGKLAEKFIRQS
jgi:uncharacterized membrane protein